MRKNRRRTTLWSMILVLVASIALVLGVAGGVVLQRHLASSHGTAALASLDVVNSAFLDYEKELQAQREQTERARAERDTEARKAREYYDRIEGIVKEANEARKLLVRTGAEHGMAQAMMLAEIDSLTLQYRALTKQYRDATGKPPSRPEPRLNVAIQIVAAEFREAHVAPYQPASDGAPIEVSPPTGG